MNPSKFYLVDKGSGTYKAFNSLEAAVLANEGMAIEIFEVEPKSLGKFAVEKIVKQVTEIL